MLEKKEVLCLAKNGGGGGCVGGWDDMEKFVSVDLFLKSVYLDVLNLSVTAEGTPWYHH